MNKTVRGATIAKAVGYEYLATKVSEFFNTSYYNVVKLDDVIEKGHSIRCPEPWRGNTVTFAKLPKGTVLGLGTLHLLGDTQYNFTQTSKGIVRDFIASRNRMVHWSPGQRSKGTDRFPIE